MADDNTDRLKNVEIDALLRSKDIFDAEPGDGTVEDLNLSEFDATAEVSADDIARLRGAAEAMNRARQATPVDAPVSKPRAGGLLLLDDDAPSVRVSGPPPTDVEGSQAAVAPAPQPAATTARYPAAQPPPSAPTVREVAIEAEPSSPPVEAPPAEQGRSLVPLLFALLFLMSIAIVGALIFVYF